MTVDSLGVNRVQLEEEFDFKNNNTQDNAPTHIYSSVSHSCEYFEVEEFQRISKPKHAFSTLSLNIRSLGGKWGEFQEYINLLNSNNFKFSVIALQEIWNVPLGLNFNLEGYKAFNFKTRDPSGQNNNAGGGVGFWVSNDFGR